MFAIAHVCAVHARCNKDNRLLRERFAYSNKNKENKIKKRKHFLGNQKLQCY